MTASTHTHQPHIWTNCRSRVAILLAIDIHLEPLLALKQQRQYAFPKAYHIMQQCMRSRKSRRSYCKALGDLFRLSSRRCEVKLTAKMFPFCGNNFAPAAAVLSLNRLAFSSHRSSLTEALNLLIELGGAAIDFSVSRANYGTGERGRVRQIDIRDLEKSQRKHVKRVFNGDGADRISNLLLSIANRIHVSLKVRGAQSRFNGRTIDRAYTFFPTLPHKPPTYKKLSPTPRLMPFLASSPCRTTNGKLKFSSNRATGSAYTTPTPTAELGSPFASSANVFCTLLCTSAALMPAPFAPPAAAVPLRPSCSASSRPPLTNSCSRSGASLPARGNGSSRLAPPAAYTSPPTASAPSRGPSPAMRKPRTSVGPPSRKRDGGLRVELELGEGDVAGEGPEAGELGGRLEQVAAGGEQWVVSAVAGPGVAEGGLEAVAGVGADGGRGGFGEAGDLAPQGGVGELVAMTSGGEELEAGEGAALGLLVAGPGFVGGGGEAAEFEAQIRVAEYGGLDASGVGGASAGAVARVGIEALGAAKDVAQKEVEVYGAVVGAGPGTGAGDEARLFSHRDEDGQVIRRRQRICGVRTVDVGGDGGVEDVELVELVDALGDVPQGFLQSVLLIVVGTEYGVEYSRKEGPASVRRIEDCDRGDGGGQARVGGDLGRRQCKADDTVPCDQYTPAPRFFVEHYSSAAGVAAAPLLRAVAVSWGQVAAAAAQRSVAWRSAQLIASPKGWVAYIASGRRGRRGHYASSNSWSLYSKNNPSCAPTPQHQQARPPTGFRQKYESSGRRNSSCANALAGLAVGSSRVKVVQVQQVGEVKVTGVWVVEVESVHRSVLRKGAVGEVDFRVGRHVVHGHHRVVRVVTLLLFLRDEVDLVFRKSDFHCREHISAECEGSDCLAKREYPSSAWLWGGVAIESTVGEAFEDDDNDDERRDGGEVPLPERGVLLAQTLDLGLEGRDVLLEVVVVGAELIGLFLLTHARGMCSLTVPLHALVPALLLLRLGLCPFAGRQIGGGGGAGGSVGGLSLGHVLGTDKGGRGAERLDGRRGQLCRQKKTAASDGEGDEVKRPEHVVGAKIDGTLDASGRPGNQRPLLHRVRLAVSTLTGMLLWPPLCCALQPLLPGQSAEDSLRRVQSRRVPTRSKALKAPALHLFLAATGFARSGRRFVGCATSISKHGVIRGGGVSCLGSHALFPLTRGTAGALQIVPHYADLSVSMRARMLAPSALVHSLVPYVPTAGGAASGPCHVEFHYLLLRNVGLCMVGVAPTKRRIEQESHFSLAKASAQPIKMLYQLNPLHYCADLERKREEYATLAINGRDLGATKGDWVPELDGTTRLPMDLQGGNHHASSTGVKAPGAQLQEKNVGNPINHGSNPRPDRSLPQTIAFLILTWKKELICWALGTAFVVAIAAILASFDNKTPPTLTYGISINTVISILVTFCYLFVTVPISNSLSQLKWNQFTRSQSLHEFQRLDAASRGVEGSLILLARGIKNPLAWFAAFLFISIQAIGPFVQQIVSAGLQTVDLGISSQLPRALRFDSAANGVISGAIGGRVLNSAYLDSTTDPLAISQVVPGCITGNCTWDPFWTLAICSSCTDIPPSDPLIRFNNNTKLTSLANGLSLSRDPAVSGLDSVPVFNMTARFRGLGKEDTTNALFVLTGLFPFNGSTWGQECVLRFCAQQYSASVEDGTLRETKLQESYFTDPDATSIGPWETQMIFNATVRTLPDRNFTFTGNDSTALSTTYTCCGDVVENLAGSMTASMAIGDTSATVATNIAGFNTVDPIFLLIYNVLNVDLARILANTTAGGVSSTLSVLPLRFANIASKMTVAMRSASGIAVSGTTSTVVIRTQVDWPWIALPIALVVLALALLVATMLDTHRRGLPLWTDSAVAMAVYGADQELRQELRDTRNINDLNMAARKLDVTLDSTKGLVLTGGARNAVP
ncbi:hypothetical protein FH972_021755 [Carpinus fangiana]|uniref:Uncharacterized protein n=1 Tax=Carpinus fangiana TaxID=176857 RepID=A0A5N6KSC3_9ROSI|nr:hypothetical protein FH972_021755 [Carpinus fangiana]